jgi:hypothetical protein
MHSENLSVGAEQVSQDNLQVIYELTQKGFSPEAISSILGLNVQTVIQVIDRADFASKDLDQEGSQCKQAQYAQEPQRLQAQSEVPTFIYSYKQGTDQLYRTSLVTGEHSSFRVPSYTFKFGCCWSEVPGGSLLITGGQGEIWDSVSDVVRIDTRKEFAVSSCTPMLTPRRYHAAVYHTPHLYILGGLSIRNLSECERHVCAENRWEALPPLPRACHCMSGVVVENSLYALGGSDGSSYLDLVQKLSLESITWELMQFRLPFEGYAIPCFKVRVTEVYLVVNKTLCSFTAFEVRPLKTLTEDILSWYGASYYHRETLYCSCYQGEALSYEIGSLSN